MINAGRIVDVDAMIRIRKGDGYTSFFRPFEDGAAGIMVPHVKSGSEAEWVVCNARYPPIGRRGTETAMSDADNSFADPLAYLQHANRETFVVVQIEDAEALDHLDEIVSLEGIDVVFVGPADLSVSLGVPFQFQSQTYLDALGKIRSAAHRHDKYWGLPVGDCAAAARYAEQGARFFCIGSDLRFFKAACVALRAEFDQVVTSTL